MVRLPENVRNTLEKLVRDLSRREVVSSVGLFGSRSRGDATAESDIDLLIVEKQDALHERLERLESNGLFIDLDSIPRNWLTGSPPPEMDQKLFEVLVLYDRDWSLTNAKDWVNRAYHRLERVGIRSETYLVDADIYVSRATSALSRHDLAGAAVFANVGLESILKTVVEAARQPFSTSRFVYLLDQSSRRLECHRFFDVFMQVSRLQSVSREDADRSIGLFKAVWEDISSHLQEQEHALGSIDSRIKNHLEYYGNSDFLRGMLARSMGLVGSDQHDEVCHYVRRVLVDILESYAWFASALEDKRLSYPLLFRSLRSLKETPSRLYENAVAAFDLQNLTRKKAEEIVAHAKRTVLQVRKARTALLQKAFETAQ